MYVYSGCPLSKCVCSTFMVFAKKSGTAEHETSVISMNCDIVIDNYVIHIFL